ncbi:MAG: glycosyltransferase [Gammaproteobacteria bacterium]|nr:glycosyltransferase [Gammaproteobacteria bacterium]
MAITLLILVILAAIFWIAIIILPIRPTATEQRLDVNAACSAGDLNAVTALIPARNEARTIALTLSSLRRQCAALKIIVVDDQSTDQTARIVTNQPGAIRLIEGTPTPAGWLGKVWALEQGLAEVNTPLVLLLDADIEMSPNFVVCLQEKLEREQLALVSVMARLRTASAWERLLVPAYIFFFKLLYPFALVNSRRTGVAAAAGGCMLMRTAVLNDIGGFAALRGAIIDDCALAGLIKRAGYPIWLGLTNSVRSMRAYETLDDFWNLVARSAFAELKFSVSRLLLCSAAMLILFCAPVVTPFAADGAAVYISIVAALAMLISYLPVLRFYSLHPSRALTLPVVAIGYLAMTWSAALRYWFGKPTIWKDRAYRNIGEY